MILDVAPSRGTAKGEVVPPSPSSSPSERRLRPLIPLMLVAQLLAACASGNPPSPGAAPTAAQRSVAALCGALSGDAWVDCALGVMSLREKAAQMVWPQVFGDYTPADGASWRRITGLIRDQRVGGVIMSVGSPIEIAVKLNALQRLSDLPLLVGGDLEVGAGFRARGGYFLPNGIDLGGATVFPPQMAIGAAGDTVLAYEQGRITAEEGRALGFHVNFAPVLDVNNNPNNPVINTRSYGESPAAVARLGMAFIHGVQSHGMLATAKHFPGHGDTDVNSHLALPVVRAGRARLDSVELVPFRAAVTGGVDAVMTFHGAMPALDSTGVPGTLSPAVLTGLLRDGMSFNGLIVTDAMDMRGVLDQFGSVEAVQRAVAAGADVLLMPADVAQAIDAVVDGVSEGRYPASRLDASARRILAAKERLGLVRSRLVDLDSTRAIVGDSAHLAVARLAAERSITLVKDSLRQLPLGRLTRGARVLAITVSRRADLAAGTTFNAEMRRTFDGLHAEFIDGDDPTPPMWRLLQAADSADVVIVSSYLGPGSTVASVAAPQSLVQLIEELVRRGRNPIVVAFGNPYLLRDVPDVPSYLVAWGGFPVSQLAAARAVLGSIAITGRLPISIPPVVGYGEGQQTAAMGASGTK